MSVRPLPMPINPALLKHVEQRRQSLENRIADAITRFAGSMLFVYLHVLWFASWIISRVEHYPFGLLTMIVSLEAIFLSTFVMISQNRADEKRQVLADHQWQTVQEEEQQNEQLLRISNQILELTRPSPRPSSTSTVTEEQQMDQDANGWKTLLTRANQLFRATTHPAALLPVEGRMPSLDGATGWLNSPPLTAAALRGHVVLINFWTYTCINWLRTRAYVCAWADTYKDQGLVVIGVHTPEFDFEHDPDNVRRAATDLRVDYPVAIDSDYAIWNAFNNHYWPAFYFVDAQGQIRHHRFGEGEYEMSEMILQQLLTEAGSSGIGIGQDLVSVDARGVEAAADWASLRSPENYLGSERTQNFALFPGAVLGTRHVYAAPPRLHLNHWALAGDWTVKREAIVLHQRDGRILYRFHARDLHLVMGPAARGTPARFHVRIDSQPPGAAHGTDVDDQGTGTVTEPRLYQLVRQPGPVSERTFEITFLDPGVHAYAFTFG